MKTSIKYILAGFFAVTFALTSFAQTANDELAKLLNDFQSMQADFTQTIIDGMGKGKKLQENHGQMALQRPGKFRWETQTPSKQLLITDGTYVWIYDVDLAQATRQSINNANTANPASLLSGSVNTLQQRFTVTKVSSAGPGVTFELRPKTKRDAFVWMQLHFLDNHIDQMRLADNLGQLSIFQFSNVRINQSLDSNLFQFVPPAKVDVIKQ